MSRLHPGGSARRTGPVLVLVLAGLLLAPTALAHTQDAHATSRAAGIETAQAVLTDQLDASGVPGGAVVVVNNDTIEARGVGDAGHGEVTGQTPFVLGSATKSFTALAVMQLVDAGLVDLDAPVRDYVSEFELAEGQPVDDITVRDILQQTSGLNDLAGGPLLASAADGTPAEAIAELKDAQLASPPGGTWLYANANYVLAGRVVERASGMAYADYVQREIFTPLGMNHSSAGAEAVGSDVLADGHRYWFGSPSRPPRPDGTPLSRPAT